MSEPRIRFDVSRATLSAQGVHGFFWPVSRRERVAVMQAYVRFFCDFARECTDEDLYLLKLSHAYLTCMVATLVQAQWLKDRAAADHDVDVPAHASMWQMVFRDGFEGVEVPKDMHKGLVRPASWRRFARALKPAAMLHGLRPRPIELVDLEAGIVSTGGDHLIYRALRQTEKTVYFCPLYEWFFPASRTELGRSPSEGMSVSLVEAFLHRLQGVLAEFDCVLGSVPLDYLRRWIDETTAWVRFYSERLRSAPERLPRELWTSSAGIIWNRMLGHAVCERGGRVTVFDHALGANASRAALTAYTDCQDCDVMITFSEPVARMIRDNCQSQVFARKMPEIRALGRQAHATQQEFSPLKPNPRPAGHLPRRILYVQPMFITDSGRCNPLMPDVVAADWQMRLFDHLGKRGYEVLVKPHPETRTQIPEHALQTVGARLIHGPFEQLYDEGDLLLYDYTLTTTFGAGLRTDRPIVLVDFGYTDLEERYCQALGRRVAIVPGRYDGDNRAQADWAALDRAIGCAAELTDSTYAEEMLGWSP